MISVKNRVVKDGQKVFVYYNLHKNCFSVKSLEGDTKNLVVLHAKKLHLTECKFVINETGRQRVLKEKRKNVHAGVIGYLQMESTKEGHDLEVIYNPYLFSSFVDSEKKEPISNATSVFLANKRTYINKKETSQ